METHIEALNFAVQRLGFEWGRIGASGNDHVIHISGFPMSRSGNNIETHALDFWLEPSFRGSGLFSRLITLSGSLLPEEIANTAH
jgi:hypothetical protein